MSDEILKVKSDMSDFDKALFEQLLKILKVVESTEDMLSMTRMCRAIYAFSLPPDEFCIIRKAVDGDVRVSSKLN